MPLFFWDFDWQSRYERKSIGHSYREPKRVTMVRQVPTRAVAFCKGCSPLGEPVGRQMVEQISQHHSPLSFWFPDFLWELHIGQTQLEVRMLLTWSSPSLSQSRLKKARKWDWEGVKLEVGGAEEIQLTVHLEYLTQRSDHIKHYPLPRDKFVFNNHPKYFIPDLFFSFKTKNLHFRKNTFQCKDIQIH